MHAEAFRWVSYFADVIDAARRRYDVLDIGGRNVNGSIRSLFASAATYHALDNTEGPEVDYVADAATWRPTWQYDVVVCCEVFEHTPKWPEIVATAFEACLPGGVFIATMAGPGRAPHGQHGAAQPADGEHYENVHPRELAAVLHRVGWRAVTVDVQSSPADVRCVARRSANDLPAGPKSVMQGVVLRGRP
jgi:hypothetical protein